MHRSSLALLALFVPLTSSPAAQTGTWGVPLQHNVHTGPGFVHPLPGSQGGPRFKAIHLALIPQPAANAGLVVAWDQQPQDGASGDWFQRWTVLDPSTDPPTILWNDELQIAGRASGDLFCAGQAWMTDGRLFVAGGTTFYPAPGEEFGGAKLTFVYDPAPQPGAPYGTWTQQPSLSLNRWYPTVTLDSDGTLVVTGGRHQNSYAAFDPELGAWELAAGSGAPFFSPPTAPAALDEYPRMHLLQTGELFMAGPHPYAAKLNHKLAPGEWIPMAQSSTHRHDGASFLYPLPWNAPDVVVILGGAAGAMHATPHATLEFCLPGTSPAPWIPGPSMNKKRVHMNSVILPDGTILVIGGNDHVAHSQVFWLDPELLTRDLQWVTQPDSASRRGYHSTAVLLPNGKVLSAGSDIRDYDWQLFAPHYLGEGAGPRPDQVALSTQEFAYAEDGGGPYTATFDLPEGSSIANVLLMAPGATTHHSDMGQRYVDLPIVAQSPGSVTFYPPYNDCGQPNPFQFCAPPGYYMLFLVSDAGVPSEARFVKLE